MTPTIPPQPTRRLVTTRRSLRAGARGSLPSLDSPTFTSWPVMRRDLLTWLVLGDLAAVMLPTALRTADGVGGILTAAADGMIMMLLSWALGALRVDVIDQARSGWGHVLAAAVVAAPLAIILVQALSPDTTPTSILVPLVVQAALAIASRVVESAWLRRCTATPVTASSSSATCRPPPVARPRPHPWATSTRSATRSTPSTSTSS